MPTVAIALGSNLGDRGAHLRWALNQLRPLLKNVKVSTFIETDPVDVPDEQGKYLNAVAVGEVEMSPQLLMRELGRIERERGRKRSSWRAARTLDLDLILHGAAMIETENLTVPHPGFRGRMFVLEPLAEIAPEMVDPKTGLTVGELLLKLQGASHKSQA
ncbi:MAG TPA: 2-amino-4-hydroxy-6-hydroxymethyldihydropteridine diphosphokinase [Vicinamibacterales bacterium]|nr:2-amino-4-hydroxy-6-hydroxymethyldihydropteridine diphosphokinase [Vicinamibacterales bacterium]